MFLYEEIKSLRNSCAHFCFQRNVAKTEQQVISLHNYLKLCIISAGFGYKWTCDCDCPKLAHIAVYLLSSINYNLKSLQFSLHCKKVRIHKHKFTNRMTAVILSRFNFLCNSIQQKTSLRIYQGGKIAYAFVSYKWWRWLNQTAYIIIFLV